MLAPYLSQMSSPLIQKKVLEASKATQQGYNQDTKNVGIPLVTLRAEEISKEPKYHS